MVLSDCENQDAGEVRLRGKTMGLRGRKWIWRRPDILVKVYSRPGMVAKEDLRRAGAVFVNDETKATSSTDSDAEGSS